MDFSFVSDYCFLLSKKFWYSICRCCSWILLSSILSWHLFDISTWKFSEGPGVVGVESSTSTSDLLQPFRGILTGRLSLKFYSWGWTITGWFSLKFYWFSSLDCSGLIILLFIGLLFADESLASFSSSTCWTPNICTPTLLNFSFWASAFLFLRSSRIYYLYSSLFYILFSLASSDF